MFKVGMGELIVILLIILLLFGASRLPEIARSLGKSVKEFKKAMKEDDEGIKKEEKK
jgi:sec-independent protein translocase protein TatA